MFLLSGQEKIQLLFEEFPEQVLGADFIFLGFIVLSLGVLIQTPLYIWLILKRTREYRRALESIYSTEAKKSISWLMFIVTGMAVAWSLTVFQQLTVADLELSGVSFYLLHCFLAIVALALCYLGFQEQKLFSAFNQHAKDILQKEL